VKNSMMNLKTTALLLAMSLAGAAQAVGVPGQGTWETTLQARDLDGNLANGPEAFYDTTLDVTWLADANQNGPMNWDAAMTWAANLNVNGVTGWRLPSVIDTGAPGCNSSLTGGTDCGYGVQTKSGLPTQYQSGQIVYSEMAHLYYVTLGNKDYVAAGNHGYNGPPPLPGTGSPDPVGYGLKNTGDFKNMQAYVYWIGKGYFTQGYAWDFYTYDGLQNYTIKSYGGLYAMAVHPGDVAAVPETQTYAMWLMGLGGLLLARWRRAV